MQLIKQVSLILMFTLLPATFSYAGLRGCGFSSNGMCFNVWWTDEAPLVGVLQGVSCADGSLIASSIVEYPSFFCHFH